VRRQQKCTRFRPNHNRDPQRLGAIRRQRREHPNSESVLGRRNVDSPGFPFSVLIHVGATPGIANANFQPRFEAESLFQLLSHSRYKRGIFVSALSGFGGLGCRAGPGEELCNCSRWPLALDSPLASLGVIERRSRTATEFQRFKKIARSDLQTAGKRHLGRAPRDSANRLLLPTWRRRQPRLRRYLACIGFYRD
jgi:hypothetical protein